MDDVQITFNSPVNSHRIVNHVAVTPVCTLEYLFRNEDLSVFVASSIRNEEESRFLSLLQFEMKRRVDCCRFFNSK